MKKGMAAILLVVGMTLGSALTMVLNPVGAANALAGTSSSSTGHQNILQQALSTLVGNGTITQKQSDAVSQQVQNLQKQHPRPSFGAFGGPGRMGGMGGLAALGRDGLSQLATALKTTPQALMTDLRGGQTIAQIAKANGVDVSSLIATLEKDADARIQQEVTSGHLTQPQATKIEAGLATAITDLVNGTFAHGFAFGFGGHGPNAPGTPPAPGPATTPVGPPSATPTTAPPASPSTTVAPSTTSTTAKPSNQGTTSTTKG
jgi:hypothetical protein